jgi:hypothetical protein
MTPATSATDFHVLNSRCCSHSPAGGRSAASHVPLLLRAPGHAAIQEKRASLPSAVLDVQAEWQSREAGEPCKGIRTRVEL